MTHEERRAVAYLALVLGGLCFWWVAYCAIRQGLHP